MKLSLPIIFDCVIGLIACYLGCNYVFSLFGANGFSLVVACIGCSVALTTLWLSFTRRVYSKKRVDYSVYLDFFACKSKTEVAEYICSALSKRYACRISEGVIAAENCNVIVDIRIAPLSPDDAVSYALNARKKTLLIVNGSAPNTVSYAKKVNNFIRVIEFDELCAWLDKLGALPALPKKEKLSVRIKAALRAFPTKRNAQKLLSIAVWVLFMSALSRFKTYYIIFSAIIAAAAACVFIAALLKKPAL